MKENDGGYYDIIYRIWSVMAFGQGTPLLEKLTTLFPDPKDMYYSLTTGEVPDNVPSAAVKCASEISLDAAEKIIGICDKKGISMVTPDEEDYPSSLKGIFCPPQVLFYKGDISGMNERLSIGVVGSRKPSEYSLKVTSGIVRMLAKSGFDIISGFAEGIDICAHLSAVKGGAKTFAVLGSGIDADYPKKNNMFRDIICENGALITEYLPGTPPHSINFPKRNRILAGLSMSVAVIEAGAQSGSLNSASHCSEQGKTVFAVSPADLFDPRYRGNVELIRHGAVTLMGARDIYSEYCTRLSHTIDESSSLAEKLDKLKAETTALSKATEEEKEKPKPALKPSVKKAEKHIEKTAPENKEAIIPDDANENQKSILTAISAAQHPLRADEISLECSLDIGDVLTELTELEIMGSVTAVNGTYSII